MRGGLELPAPSVDLGKVVHGSQVPRFATPLPGGIEEAHRDIAVGAAKLRAVKQAAGGGGTARLRRSDGGLETPVTVHRGPHFPAIQRVFLVEEHNHVLAEPLEVAPAPEVHGPEVGSAPGIVTKGRRAVDQQDAGTIFPGVPELEPGEFEPLLIQAAEGGAQTRLSPPEDPEPLGEGVALRVGFQGQEGPPLLLGDQWIDLFVEPYPPANRQLLQLDGFLLLSIFLFAAGTRGCRTANQPRAQNANEQQRKNPSLPPAHLFFHLDFHLNRVARNLPRSSGTHPLPQATPHGPSVPPRT